MGLLAVLGLVTNLLHAIRRWQRRRPPISYRRPIMMIVRRWIMWCEAHPQEQLRACMRAYKNREEVSSKLQADALFIGNARV